jgi:serine/threonine protein kinase
MKNCVQRLQILVWQSCVTLMTASFQRQKQEGPLVSLPPKCSLGVSGVVSTKSDVYSYGMVLLEMVRGRNEVKEVTDSSSETFFPHWVYDRLVRAMHNCQVAHSTEEIARKLTLVGLWCVQMTPENRPSMSRVIEMLERKIDEMEIPPRPFLCSPSQSTNVSSCNSVVVMMQS